MEAPQPKPTITYDDFAKLDLRVAKIMEVEPVQGSDKLYKLTILLGEETRVLAAGLAKHYAPDELMGKRIVIIANLAPRKIKGIESQGMLLAAFSADDSVVAVLTPDKDVPLGSAVG